MRARGLATGAALSLALAVAAVSGAADPPVASPEPPRQVVDTKRSASPGRTHQVAAGGNLQAALDAARPGDQIVLAAGAVFRGPFRLPAKRGEGWIVLTTSAEERLPPPGTRVGPAHAVLMPVLLARNGPALVTESGAHSYRFVGVAVRPEPGRFVHNLVQLGADERTLETLPRHFVFDRCLIEGDPRVGGRRGIAMNSAFTAVVDSHLAGFKEVGADSQAIATWNGSGPFAIVNSYLEAAGENVLFGGADPTVPGLVPADIVVRANHFSKPLSWKVGHPTFQGTPWAVKNLFEAKNARRVLVEGNVFEHNWPHAQNGFAILFTVRNQDGRSPWSVVEDVRFVRNVVRRVAAGINVLGRDDNHPSGRAARILIAHNLLSEVGTPTWGGTGALLQLLHGTMDVVVERNTVLQAGPVLVAEGEPHQRFVFRGNVVLDQSYGIVGTDMAPGVPTLQRYFPGAIVTDNVIVGGAPTRYPGGNRFPRSLEAAGIANGSGQLRVTAGRGGAAVGADLAALTEALDRAVPAPLLPEFAGRDGGGRR